MYVTQLESYRKSQSIETSRETENMESVTPIPSAPLASDYSGNKKNSGYAQYAAQLETYRTVQNSVLSGREIEAAVLTRCALMLSECQQNWDTSDREEKLEAALTRTQKVWSIFQSELTSEDNPLPKQLKENILNLSIFIDKRIIEIMAHPSPEKLKILIDINLNLAAGLRSNPTE